MTELLLFYTFGALAVLLAVAVVTTRRILRAAVYLTGVLLASAAFYLMLHAEFLAGVQVLVYIGGIVVLLVFAIMLTSAMELLEDHPSRTRRGVGLLVATAFFAAGAWMLQATDFHFTPGSGERSVSDVHEIGRALMDYGPSGYVLPFEIISVLLLAAIIGSVVVARKVEDKVEKADTGGRDA